MSDHFDAAMSGGKDQETHYSPTTVLLYYHHHCDVLEPFHRNNKGTARGVLDGLGE